jgi:hypothetical protein
LEPGSGTLNDGESNSVVCAQLIMDHPAPCEL